MRGSRNKILALTVGSACLLAMSVCTIEPKVHSYTDSIALGPAGVRDGRDVARWELEGGEEIQYSFEASSTVRFFIDWWVIDPDIFSAPLLSLLMVSGMSAEDSLTAPEHGGYILRFVNPSDSSGARVSYTISHHIPLPATTGLLLILLAMMVASPAILAIVFFKRWQIREISPGQRAINNLWERRRAHPSSAWIRH